MASNGPAQAMPFSTMPGWRWRRSIPGWKRRAGPRSLQERRSPSAFKPGHEMNWLPRAMHVLHDELKNIQVTITSDYSPDLAEALVRGRLDVAFMRTEPTFDLCYEVVDHEPLVVLMPSDHRLTSREAIHPREFIGEI